MANKGADHAPHLGERLAARRLDRFQHFPRPLGAGIKRHPLSARLHHDHAHAVGDHVMQLARDARTFLLGRNPGPGIAISRMQPAAPEIERKRRIGNRIGPAADPASSFNDHEGDPCRREENRHHRSGHRRAIGARRGGRGLASRRDRHRRLEAGRRVSSPRDRVVDR